MSQPICQTYAKNATTHPGQIVLDAQLKRRTRAEKTADDQHLQAAQDAKEALAVAGLNRLAALQNEMEEAQVQSMMKKPKAVRPRPLSKEDESAPEKAGNSSKAAVLRSTEDSDLFDEGLPINEDLEDDETKKKKKGRKNAPQSLKAAINNASNNLLGAVIAGHNQPCAQNLNKKGNSLPLAKSTLGGCIQNWRSTVPGSQKSELASPGGSQLASLTTTSQPPPSTIFSKSQISHTSNATSLSSNACEISKLLVPIITSMSNVSEDTDDLVGGLGEDLDDWQEHDVAVSAKGKSTVEMRPVADPELVPPPLAQRLSGRVTSGMKRKLDLLHFSSDDNLLTPEEDKIEELEIEDLELEIEGLETDEQTMEVDEIETQTEVVRKPVAGKIQQATMTVKAPCTTASTSVGTTSQVKAPPPSKKARIENTPVKSELMAPARSKENGSWVEPQPKSCCDQDNKWAREFLPTVILWLGTQDKLWAVSDPNLLHACQEIFKVVYPNIWYQVVMSGSVFSVQLWINCARYGDGFLIANKDTLATELATLLLEHYAFLYPDPDNINKDATFHSAFVQELLATAHLSRIIGHANVPALDTNTLAKSGITGALGLCAVLLERTLTLVVDKAIIIDQLDDLEPVPGTAQKARPKMPKTVNPATGKASSTEHAFSVGKWGLKTATYIQGAQKKSVEAMQLTMSMAYKHLKKPGFNKYSSSDSSDEMDDCADICPFLLSLDPV
ncbi:uncharacterized protein EDB91DRAFT_1086013 [Suillus paluster]|uniref:uncharacterized protein n=1 Tax=Suillus paluster TaxID=48578 RepID=UPI001B88667B|nr:uncharacterized protein EDB91DRAFT_1086013 [Suillus paluster]KAG1728599.1 hypothetical protein EDB91DRAFT_1086013 [Suillus paluster]